MIGKKNIQWRWVVVKTLVVGSILFMPMLGIHYRPTPNVDYSSVNALETKNGITKVDFGFLGGFDYDDEKIIPPKIMKLDGRRIEIKGFMLPVDFGDGVVKSFMLLNNQMGCCFGVTPRVNDFVYVQLPEGKSTKFLTDIPLKVTGTIRIGRDNLVGGLYTMTAEKVQLFKDY